MRLGENVFECATRTSVLDDSFRMLRCRAAEPVRFAPGRRRSRTACDTLREAFSILISTGVIRMKLCLSVLFALFLFASSITIAQQPAAPRPVSADELFC